MDSVNAEDTSQFRIGLSLSGGGFRATLFHLGILRFLRERGLLVNVSHVCSVSGGSITGAHLVLNWDRYTGEEAEFESAAHELVAFTQTDLRGSVVRPWLFSYVAAGIPRLISPGAWTRTKLCESQYDRLFDHATLRKLTGITPGTLPPDLHLLSTSLTTGDLVSFNRNGIDIEDEDSSTHISTNDVPVAMGVAASSAFPPLFAPVPMNAKSLGLTDPSMLPVDHFLTDGGVYDNLGIRKLLWLNNKSDDISFDLIVASRAERDNPEEYGNPYPFVWQRASRSTDLMMQRISWFERDSIARLEQDAACKVLVCELTEHVGEDNPFALPRESESRVQTIRTDLDEFSDDEVNGLVQHGYAVINSAWQDVSEEIPSNVKHNTPSACWLPRSHVPDRQLDLANSHKTKPGLFRVNDWASWAVLTLILTYLAIPVGIIVWQRHQVVQAMRLAKVAEDERQRERNRVALVDAAVKLVEGLAALLVSDSHQQYSIALEKWQSELKEQRSSKGHGGFFMEVFNEDQVKSINDKLDSIGSQLQSNASKNVVEVLSNAKFDTVVLDVSHQLRNHLLNHATDGREYERLLKSRRVRFYDEDQSVTQELINWADGKGNRPISRPEDVKVSRNRFRMLYWGVLGLVEGKQVEGKMVKFGIALEAWEDWWKTNKPDGGELTEDETKGVLEVVGKMEQARSDPDEGLVSALNKELGTSIAPR